MNSTEDRAWDWIRRGAGLLFLAYIIFANPAVPSWVGLIIAGLLGLPDVIAGQFAINRRAAKTPPSAEQEKGE